MTLILNEVPLAASAVLPMALAPSQERPRGPPVAIISLGEVAHDIGPAALRD